MGRRTTPQQIGSLTGGIVEFWQDRDVDEEVPDLDTFREAVIAEILEFTGV